MEIKRFVVNPLEENCYVLSSGTGEAVIIDNGTFYAEEKEALFHYFEDNKLTPVRQLLTHAHFDHLFGTGDFYERYGLKADFHADDAYLYFDVTRQLEYIIGRGMNVKVAPLGTYLKEGDIISFGTHQLKVIHTPGHSRGGVAYYCEKEKVIFCGDTIFKGSIGRTDLEGGDQQQLIDSIKQKILTLPDDVVIWPGHGQPTTVAEERGGNPYLLM